MRVVYFFAGVERKASLADFLSQLCKASGQGLQLEEVDIYRKGSDHDLLSKSVQDAYISDIESGLFDYVILSPPCGTWSRANFANSQPPQPCRDRDHPWGVPNQEPSQQRRATQGTNS